TKEIFADPELTRDSIPIKITNFSQASLRNDLEPVAKRRFPEIGQCLQWLENYAPARMTGSGGAVFAAFSDEGSAQKALNVLPETMQGFVAEGWSVHPLAGL
ncbi:MAG: 4-(cytidine 5'-diphospho)-2-C-methyl-D-erythritol kinase, partial [Pseudomonadota bacterium]|nr:4-(cytidine 5'-diphospho)-2-C-methyl-D-erythritol kinase [Pseudomonadota bacterium]